jgi:hypothetical protein
MSPRALMRDVGFAMTPSPSDQTGEGPPPQTRWPRNALITDHVLPPPQRGKRLVNISTGVNNPIGSALAVRVAQAAANIGWPVTGIERNDADVLVPVAALDAKGPTNVGD